MITEEIYKDIEKLRLKLIKCGLKEGLNSPQTIRLSEELDKIILKVLLNKVS
ncbi:aspartyl-phosphate phosphatase Spo0E family protein [Litchfieldia salsa]|uniref:Spo0E like sporulation regulatory protein n=1 Tax=Litchfieldia salsa TaxID=930152 RepID=A0A1H0W7C1_9BACI|nr:aspartyl-phosphate phosphatase Spo0E family protein [Litchfieldia salsa]SDP86518.1 Spo0E like sporulation regulatory protein [Litchfieldia salsa]